MFRKKLLLFVSFVLLVGLFAYTGQASVNASKQEGALPLPPTGELTDPLLFEERWSSGNLPNERWEITNGTWITTTNGIIRQDDDTPEQINIAHEKVADIADGVIYGQMQLLTIPETEKFPHGFLFRYSGVNNFYGVGFIDEETLALGRVVGGIPDDPLVSVPGFDALALHQFKIVLKRYTDPNTGDMGRIEVYVAEGDDPLPTIPEIVYNSPLLDSPQFRAGKVGVGTYGARADFGPLLVDFDCSEFYDDLSVPGQAVYDALADPFDSDSARTFCGNEVVEVIKLPGEEGDAHREAFVKYADLIATAKYEVAFTTMIFDNPGGAEDDSGTRFASSGALALLGYDPGANEPPPTIPTGLPALYEDVVANQNDYPYGINVRILLGLKGIDRRIHVLKVLKDGKVPLCDPVPTCEKWRIEVAYYEPFSVPLRHSHVKLLVVDREEAIISGYNVQNEYYTKEMYDLGIHVAGPAAYEAMQRFQELWEKARSSDTGLCEPGVDDLSTITNLSKCNQFSPGPAGVEDGEYPPPVKAIRLRDENQLAFTLYHTNKPGEKEADEAITAGLRSATDHIYIWQVSFYRNAILVETPAYMSALEDVIKENVDNNNTDFIVRLLVASPDKGGSGGSIGSDWGGTSVVGMGNRKGVAEMRELLGEQYQDYLEVRLFMPRMHTKALAIDGEFLIIGSQNWEHSAWGSGGSFDLAELNLGVDDGAFAGAFDNTFTGYWDDSDFAQAPCERFPEDSTWSDFGDCEENLGNTEQIPVFWLHDGVYQGSDIEIDEPAHIIGLGAETILEPEIQVGTEPILRITSSDVSLMGLHFRNSAGYAIEIGDGVTPVENVFIGFSLFTNNTLGGIKINGPASIYVVENNTFVGGEAGLLINVSGGSAEKSLVRNNLFSGQTVAPVKVDSAGDGRVDYSYNLFDNCIRAVGGVCPANWLVGTMHPESKEYNNLLNVPPVFRDPGNGDYQLSYPSAALDAADPAAVDLAYHGDGDSDGFIGADIGALEYYTDTLAPLPILLAPLPGELVTPTVTLVMSGTQSTDIEYEIATDGQFLNLAADGQTVMTATEQLDPGVYYWRAKMDDCCSDWSAVRQFTVAEPWVEGEQLLGEEAGDNFGQVVATHQETLVVGAPEYDGKGAAYVYVFDGVNWQLQARLTAGDGAAGDAFGTSVAIYEDTIVVGAPNDDDNGTDSGSAYVFTRDGDTWTQHAKVLPTAGQADAGFGHSVTVSTSMLESTTAGTIAIGAPWEDSLSLTDIGAVYVFKYTGSTWSQQTRLVRPSSGPILTGNHQFGKSVALDGTRLIVGVPLDSVPGISGIPGSVYVFGSNGVNWIYKAQLLSNDLENGDRLGGSVAIRDNTVIVGADGVDDQGAESGAAYIFSYDGTQWKQIAKLVAADGAAGDHFGYSVSTDGDDVAVGAYHVDSSGVDAGAVYFYSEGVSTWDLKNRLIPLDGAASDWFGYSVALDGGIAVVGAYGDDSNGAAYVVNRLYE